MKLNAKLNVVMLAVFSVGLLVSGYLSYTILNTNARKVVLEQATLLMDAATAVQGYTSDEVAPELSPHINRKFLPQVVAAYAATQTLGRLTSGYADYSYKEATLNPTNARDKAFEWEADLVERFRRGEAERQIIGTRPTTEGDSLYLARPIKISEESCLACHGDPADAPKSMLAQYGPANGFGWQLNEIVGARIVSVPLSASLEQARQAFFVFMALMVVMFATFIIVLNTMLKRMVISPAATMSEIADEVSKGNLDVPAFEARGDDEMSTLAASFNRMRRSLEKAMRMLER
ncbi:MAG: DUF3365 domain-containing protein [Gammaproteobacteria bacterium]|nr:DUF3365 domain-containing protein [Gammaproteobacteria bacterium]